MTMIHRGRPAAWIPACLRRSAERLAPGMVDRPGEAPRLDAARRSWLLQDLREDLGCLIEDVEERGSPPRARRSSPGRRSVRRFSRWAVRHVESFRDYSPSAVDWSAVRSMAESASC